MGRPPAARASLAFAFWTWASGQTAFSPGTDVLISGINVATIGDLMKGDRVGILSVVRSGALIAALVAGLLSPFLIGGTLATFRSPEHRVLPAMLAGAGQAPGALVAIWLVTRGLALLLGLASAMACQRRRRSRRRRALGARAHRRVLRRDRPRGGGLVVLRRGGRRCDDSAERSRSPFRVSCHLARRDARASPPARVAGIWLLRGAIPAGLRAGALSRNVGRGADVPAALIGLQQSVMVVRAMCRVAILGAERDLVVSLRRRRVQRGAMKIR